MKNCKSIAALACLIISLTVSAPEARAQKAASSPKSASASPALHLVITDAAFRNDAELPPLQKENLTVKQGKTPVQVSQLIPAQGNNDALQLMILIDDVLDGQSIGNNLNDLKGFIKALPPSTVVAVGYMSNTSIQLAQNFTADHDLAVKAIRLPRGSLSAMDSPYLSLISLVKSWQQQNVRREIIMISDGIDRLRGERPSVQGRMGPGRPNATPVYHSMPTVSQDASNASEVSQRYNVIVFPIYAPGVGRAGRSSWDQQLGLSGLTEIADETGGECFSLSTSNAVSFKPYLDRMQQYFNNQYYLVFSVPPGIKDGLQRISIRMDGDDAEILAPDNVWVPKSGK